jgi:hypothetical protein
MAEMQKNGSLDNELNEYDEESLIYNVSGHRRLRIKGV